MGVVFPAWLWFFATYQGESGWLVGFAVVLCVELMFLMVSVIG